VGSLSTVQLIKRFLPYTKGRINLAVGFGVSKPEHVKTILKSGADGAIVGSAFVRTIEQNQDHREEMLHKLEGQTSEFKEWRASVYKRPSE